MTKRQLDHSATDKSTPSRKIDYHAQVPHQDNQVTVVPQRANKRQVKAVQKYGQGEVDVDYTLKRKILAENPKILAQSVPQLSQLKQSNNQRVSIVRNNQASNPNMQTIEKMSRSNSMSKGGPGNAAYPVALEQLQYSDHIGQQNAHKALLHSTSPSGVQYIQQKQPRPSQHFVNANRSMQKRIE